MRRVKLKREDSPRILLEQKNLERIAEWLLYSLMRSLKKKEKFDFPIDTPLGKSTITQIFVSNPQRLCPDIFKASQNDRDMVIKFFNFSDEAIDEDKHQKFADRLIQERKYVEELSEIPSLVKLAITNPAADNKDKSKDNSFVEKYVLCMEDAGNSLKSVIVSGLAGKHLAKIVYRDIWKVALPALSSKNLCFADIHPGNICVKWDAARLVDLESIKPVDESLDNSPIFLREKAPPEAQLDWDEASVAAILRCLWYDGNFDKLEEYAEEFMATTKRNEFMTQHECDF